MLLDGEYTQGAHGDLSSATQLAFHMATQYGMTRLGYQVRHAQSAAGNDAVAEVVEELLADAHVSATALVTEYQGFLAGVAEGLLDAETLTLSEIRTIAERCGVTGPATVTVPPPPRRAPRPAAPAA